MALAVATAATERSKIPVIMHKVEVAASIRSAEFWSRMLAAFARDKKTGEAKDRTVNRRRKTPTIP